ncbi:Hypothetical protein FKW44_020546 [Caligus rogercresseyi]|uniref:Uncharacterized protein n=1 Tax=Caligus rogercresseyi TaxID=217165 RepID=A0A7T8GXP5_CALRO|nr:Hypothetical protein FKW44_020546 [Caligus rogercresseyi]
MDHPAVWQNTFSFHSTLRIILHFKISGRAAKSYHLIQFTRVIDHFNKTGSIHKKNK